MLAVWKATLLEMMNDAGSLKALVNCPFIGFRPRVKYQRPEEQRVTSLAYH